MKLYFQSAQPEGKVIYDPNYTPENNSHKLTQSKRPDSATVHGSQNREEQSTKQQRQDVVDDVSEDEEDLETKAEKLFGELDELTGQPVADDELLFALPVCAPYSALLNYKYKVSNSSIGIIH